MRSHIRHILRIIIIGLSGFSPSGLYQVSNNIKSLDPSHIW